MERPARDFIHTIKRPQYEAHILLHMSSHPIHLASLHILTHA